ncbi:Mut7-C RNAse domain-containing protein [Dehalogenimonas formicexedens]|uniref:Mut7-C RNAse domain-containing protein n=1 Tax=Dehalogenimonas formicexedens TaxID=1839801 RepID=UPI001CEF8FE2|nr:Mut7-C RNAse domain-containing protein [Dehalogenimonas formicexedens]
MYNRTVDEPCFLVDQNVGKLARWLRLLGYDAAFFTGEDDSRMVKQALAENRIILTRDTAIQYRRVATSGRLKVVTFETEDAEVQMRQLLSRFQLVDFSRPFTRCLEDNSLLRPVDKPAALNRVPAYTFKTQDEFMECPVCCRVYWRGSHWQALERRLARFRHQ